MISGQKTAYALARHHQVVVLTTGEKTTVEQANSNLKIYRLKDIFLRDPINFSIVPGLFTAVRRIIKEEKPDAFLINKHMFFTSLAIWPIKWLGYKVVVQTDTFPGINWFPKNKLVRVVMWLYARLIGNFVLRAATKVILLHEGLVPDAKKLGLNYTVIHNGIDLKHFDTSPPPHDLKKERGAIWIGYVGRLESIKGWDMLGAAALDLVQDNDRIHFFFIGPTKNAKEKINQFNHPQIHFLGLRKDIAGIDKLLDIFVMPSHSEGLSNAVMEAMAAGCCCLVSGVGGNMILIKDGVTGRLFAPGDQADLHDKLTVLVRDPAEVKRLGAEARIAVENGYQLEKNVRTLAHLLSSL